LAGGKHRAADTAITSLLRDRVLDLDHMTQSLVVREQRLNATSPLERAVIDMVETDGDVRRVRIAAAESTSHIRKRLSELELLMAGGRDRLMRLVPMSILFAVLLLGVSKVGLGISRGKSVAILVCLCIVTTAACALFAWPSKRSRWGSRMLATLQDQNRRARSRSATKSPTDHELPLGVALFGATALIGTELAYLRQHLEKPPQATIHSGAGSGCGAGGAGCGAGGGGGGCGGGGCGGCGG
jgi:uncharacterized protein (TIGR04222 family)